MSEEITEQIVQTNIAEQLDASLGHDPRLDAYAKNVLADVQVLAYLLKYSLEEFQDYSREEIQGYIEPDIQISKVRVEPGLTNAQRIDGSATESSIPNEGKTYFDIVFRAKTPKEEFEIIINVEAQRSSDPNRLNYHIENRMTFYIARLTSSQKQIDFQNSNYDDLKKAKSIWICMDSEEDSIIRYRFLPEVVFGHIDPIPQADRMEGIMIRIRTGKTGSYKDSRNQLIAMLEHLFREEPVERKKEQLTQDGLKMTRKLERSVNAMCNYSSLVLEKGLNEGFSQGRTSEKRATVMRLYQAKKDIETIALAADLSTEEVEQIIQEELAQPVK